MVEGRASPAESSTGSKNPDEKDLNRITTVQSEAPNLQQRDFPRRTYAQEQKLWVFFPEDRTTYFQYFRRPFALFLFPNVVISGCIFAFGCTGKLVSPSIIASCVLIYNSWYRLIQYHLRDLDRTALRLEHFVYGPCLSCGSRRQLRRMADRRSVRPDRVTSRTKESRYQGA